MPARLLTEKNAGRESGDVNLSYNYPADKTVRYLTTSKIVQNMDINGQTMQTNVKSGFAWSTMDSSTSNTSTMTTTMKVKSENKFEVFENIKGKEYAKITSLISGTRDMKT